jgi:hypothetical protein
MECMGIFHGHLEDFTSIWCILWQFGIFCGHLVYFPMFWHVLSGKIWQPCITLIEQCKFSDITWNQSSDFLIYNYNAGAVCST